MVNQAQNFLQAFARHLENHRFSRGLGQSERDFWFVPGLHVLTGRRSGSISTRFRRPSSSRAQCFHFLFAIGHWEKCPCDSAWPFDTVTFWSPRYHRASAGFDTPGDLVELQTLAQHLDIVTAKYALCSACNVADVCRPHPDRGCRAVGTRRSGASGAPKQALHVPFHLWRMGADHQHV